MSPADKSNRKKKENIFPLAALYVRIVVIGWGDFNDRMPHNGMNCCAKTLNYLSSSPAIFHC